MGNNYVICHLFLVSPACLERLSTSTVLIGYYHGLLLRDTNADLLISHLYHNELLLTHEQESNILSGHSLHHRNWLLLEHVRHMNPSSLMIFSKLVNDLWPQIGIQLVTGIVMVLLAMVIVMYMAGEPLRQPRLWPEQYLALTISTAW